MIRVRSMAGLIIACILIAGCQQQGIPPEALQLSPQSLSNRLLQTRKFETRDEKFVLQAVAGLLQDTGFNIDESETDLGVIVGSKDRDATETGQVVGAIVLAVLFGVSQPIDDTQKIRASIVTKAYGDEDNPTYTSVRVTFQRIVWDNRGKISKVEHLDDPKFYQEFFDRLSKAIFLEARGI
ncbi:MAG: hypothetical protein O7A03_05670 [Alphaproteobacteria bacterium]|nr:hypothetical protein [Alphaproteobacteria bacterium]